MYRYSAGKMVASLRRRLWSAARSAADRQRGWISRQLITRNRRVALGLAAVVVAIGIGAVRVPGQWLSPGVMILPILAGGLLLWPRALRILFLFVAAMLAYDIVNDRAGLGIGATIVITALFADVQARTRKKLGMQGLRGDQMLIELGPHPRPGQDARAA